MLVFKSIYQFLRIEDKIWKFPWKFTLLCPRSHEWYNSSCLVRNNFLMCFTTCRNVWQMCKNADKGNHLKNSFTPFYTVKAVKSLIVAHCQRLSMTSSPLWKYSGLGEEWHIHVSTACRIVDEATDSFIVMTAFELISILHVFGATHVPKSHWTKRAAAFWVVSSNNMRTSTCPVTLCVVSRQWCTLFTHGFKLTLYGFSSRQLAV